jgi:XTP/dITP diphosphohydrolase
MKELIFATHNQHKSKEIKNITQAIVNVLDLEDIAFYTDIPENGDTLKANAFEKASFVFNKIGKPVFADDTGLEVDALMGKPGVHSARYAGEPKSDRANLEKLIREMDGVQDRSARFRTVICYMYENEVLFFEGVVNGEIIQEKRGLEGFGYDPVFIPDGYDKTFAEIDLAIKNQISHRGKAFQKFVGFLKDK